MSREGIIEKSYKLLKEAIPVFNRFPKNYKFTLGDRIQHQLSDLLELYINAFYKPPAEKKALLSQANVQLEILRHYFRLCYELGLYSSKKYQYFSKALNLIGQMTGGWIKALNK